MSLVLTPEQAQEARALVARLVELLGSPDAAPAAPAAPQEPTQKVGLRDVDYADAADALKCDVAAIRAVDEVESRGHGFGPDGRPTVLFEPHVFSRLTNHRFDSTYGGVSYPKWGQKPYPTGTAEERHKANWDKIIFAAKLDRDAAYQSASYGRFQIMGFNWRDCAFSTLDEFLAAMHESERRHLLVFVQLVTTWRLDDELRAHDWLPFAERYNGPGQKEAYAAKLAEAFAAQHA